CRLPPSGPARARHRCGLTGHPGTWLEAQEKDKRKKKREKKKKTTQCRVNNYQLPFTNYSLLRRKNHFVTSSATAGSTASPSTTSHSLKLSAWVLKIGCRNGTKITTSSRASDSP